MSGNEVPRRTRLSPADRRARILAAAADVFAAHGYDRASMREVARTAGVTTPVVYDHFPSKAALYATLVESYSADLMGHWAAKAQVSTPEGMFRESIDAIFSWIEENEGGWRVLFLDSPSDEDVARAFRRKQEEATDILAGLFHRVPHLNLSTDLDRARADRLFAEAAKWAVNAVAGWWWHNRELSREQIVLLTADLLWGGLERLMAGPEDHENGEGNAP
jgi:AcrR family transcriptional regulator